MGDGSVGEERSALDSWKKETEDNIKALEDIQKIASLSNSLTGYQDFNVDDAWNSFSSKIEESQISYDVKSSNKTPIISLRSLSRIAAVLVIVLGSVFGINHFVNSPSDALDEMVYISDVKMMEFDLVDGSHVTLDKNSDLKVLNERDVELKGRAHFDVERNESKQFKINLPVGNVVVLGTKFIIDASPSTTEVYVEEGSVRYQLADRTWTLVAGDLVKVRNNVATVLKGRDINYASWKNQRLIFRDNNMEEVVDALARHFKKEIIIENKKIFSKCNVMNVFTNSSLNDILNGLSKTHGLKYKLKENKVFIVSAKC